MELQKMRAIEAFIGENITDYVEKKLGIDYRIAIEEKRLTAYIRGLIDSSQYFQTQLKGREKVDVVNQLICSRVIEHRLLDKWKGKVRLNGSDKDKLITEYSSYLPDLKEVAGSNYYEVISTFNGNFVLNSTLFVRDGKLNYLMEFAKTHKVYIVAVDVLAKTYCFIPIKPDIEAMDYVTAGASLGYQIDLKDIDWFLLDESDLIIKI